MNVPTEILQWLKAHYTASGTLSGTNSTVCADTVPLYARLAAMVTADCSATAQHNINAANIA